MAQPIPTATPSEADVRLENAKRKFIDTLRTIFQFDAADLDFGIYRVLNMRRAALEKFLVEDLTPQIETLLKAGGSVVRDALEEEVAKIEESLRSFGVKDFATTPRWVELTGKLAAMPDTSTLAREVFSDLTLFFSRYYEDGDFMALPRYKANAYAIPYDGSEVKLHWANADQYYVKSTEVFGDYRVKLEGLPGEGPRFLNLKLAAAEADRDNNKASEKRRFVLRGETPYTVAGDTLTCWLEWKVVLKEGGKGSPSQEELNTQAAQTILEHADLAKDWQLVLARKATQDAKRPAAEQRSALLFQLYRYTRKQSSDYFIHKDLGGFLRRELDFFIKNEVLNLDNVDAMDEAAFAVPLRKVRALRAVALKIITWLAQAEDFQKRLFLKKKLVLKTDVIVSQMEFRKAPPAELRQAGQDNAMRIAFGDSGLRDIQPELGTVMDGNRPAVYATRDGRGILEWLIRIENVDDKVIGVLVSAENLAALRLVGPSLHPDHIFIDPPYNTGVDGFPYKDSYQHSSWLSMMDNRLRALQRVAELHTLLGITIDYVEVSKLRILCDEVFGAEQFVADIAWEKRYTRSNNAKKFYSLKDTVLAYALSPQLKTVKELRSEKSKENYTNPDNDERGPWISSSYVNPALKKDRPNLVYPIVNPFTGAAKEHETHAWKYDPETHAEHVRDRRLYWGETGSYEHPRLKSFLSEAREGMVPVDYWSHEETGTNDEAGQELKSMFGAAVFSTPKPIRLVQRFLGLRVNARAGQSVLDCFAGSGSTGHATIDLNRGDGGTRRFSLIESGDHFHTVLVPRIVKATYASEWKDGKPQKIDPIKALYKVIELESYDDTLENLELTPPDASTQQILDLNAQTREDYTLRYLLDLESDGSLLDLKAFERPWSYTLKVRRGGLVETSPVDLVETFNYLLGLHVKSYDTHDRDGLLFVQGLVRAPEGATEGDRKTLIVWRDVATWPNPLLEGEVMSAPTSAPLLREGERPHEAAAAR